MASEWKPSWEEDARFISTLGIWKKWKHLYYSSKLLEVEYYVRITRKTNWKQLTVSFTLLLSMCVGLICAKILVA